MSQRDKWNARYSSAELPTPLQACEVLRCHSALLPKQGRALDLACGLGSNALWLAEHGLEVEAWDIADAALEKLQSAASQHKLSAALSTRQRDAETQPPEPLSFDVIVVSRFLHRPGLPALAQALRPGGLLFYQTFNLDKPAGGPSSPDFLLEPGELPAVFSDLTLRFYQEYGRTGDLNEGNRHETLFVGQAPPAHS